MALTTWLVEGLDSQPCLSYSRSQWLFALAACLEKPIHGGTGAAFRCVHCVQRFLSRYARGLNVGCGRWHVQSCCVCFSCG